MADSCPTVRIDVPTAPGGYVVINEEDFDPKTMKIWIEPSEKTTPQSQAKPSAKK
jgi:hypothetical protein